MAKVEVSKVSIKVGKKTVELTLVEAKELQQILNDTFGKHEITIVPSSPIVIERPVYIRPWRYWEVTWTAGNTMSISSSIHIRK